MIIDPPSVFSPLEDWIAFQRDMEALVHDDPNNAEASEYLGIAKEKVRSLS